MSSAKALPLSWGRNYRVPKQDSPSEGGQVRGGGGWNTRPKSWREADPSRGWRSSCSFPGGLGLHSSSFETQRNDGVRKEAGQASEPQRSALLLRLSLNPGMFP